MQWSTRAANSRGSPSRLGNGTEAPSEFLRFLRQRAQHRRAENARRNSEHTNSKLREFAGGRQRQRSDTTFGRGIGGLPDLSFKGRDRRGGHDHAAFAAGERLGGLHGSSNQPHHVERADQVDADDALVVGQRHRPFAANNTLGGADAGAVDKDARGPMRAGSLLDRCFATRAVRDVAGDGDTFDLRRNVGCGFLIDVDDRHLGAGRRQGARGGGAEARCTSGHDGRLSFGFHQCFPSTAMMRDDSGSA